MKLNYVTETTLARLYEDAQGRQAWVPKTQITHTTKYPSVNGRPEVHEVTISEWWLQRNDFKKPPQQQKELL